MKRVRNYNRRNINEGRFGRIAKNVGKGVGKAAIATALGAAALHGCEKDFEYQDAVNKDAASHNIEKDYQDFCKQNRLNPDNDMSRATYNKWVDENKQYGRNTVRLTESQLHRVIKESVRQILREYGEGDDSQHKLGRLAARQATQGRQKDASNTMSYAKNARKKSATDKNHEKRLAKSNLDGWTKQMYCSK